MFPWFLPHFFFLLTANSPILLIFFLCFPVCPLLFHMLMEDWDGLLGTVILTVYLLLLRELIPWVGIRSTAKPAGHRGNLWTLFSFSEAVVEETTALGSMLLEMAGCGRIILKKFKPLFDPQQHGLCLTWVMISLWNLSRDFSASLNDANVARDEIVDCCVENKEQGCGPFAADMSH